MVDGKSNRRKTSYANASTVLPKYVLDLIHNSFETGLLWIPPSGSAEKRDDRVIFWYEEGYSSAEIARKVRLTQRRVNQIIQRYRAVLALAQNSQTEEHNEPK